MLLFADSTSYAFVGVRSFVRSFVPSFVLTPSCPPGGGDRDPKRWRGLGWMGGELYLTL